METTDQNEAPPAGGVAERSEAAAPQRSRVQFTGTGAEYFRIWIVNLLLTIVTLGIYSAWAKVRKLQYFYRNTRLDGSAFDYHGNPMAILKGRILAALMLVVYKLSIRILGPAALVVVFALLAALPWLLTQSYRFRLHNSSFRGLRFRFQGPAWQAYLLLSVPIAVLIAPSVLIGAMGGPGHVNPRPLGIGVALGYLVLLLIGPYLHYGFKRWQHGNASYGTARASFEASAWSFYRTYLLAFAIQMGVFVVGLALMFGIGRPTGPGGGVGFWHMSFKLGFLVFLMYCTFFAVASMFTARLQNVVWRGTRLQTMGFSSDVRAAKLIGINLTNLLMIVFSLGLLIPFAVIRSMKYRVESIEILDAGALAQIARDGREAPVGATGEGAMDVLDLDFGL